MLYDGLLTFAHSKIANALYLNIRALITVYQTRIGLLQGVALNCVKRKT